MSSRIPEARERLIALADKLGVVPMTVSAISDEIHDIVNDLMFRKPRTMKKPRYLTKKLLAEIKKVKRKDPALTPKKLAKMYGVSPERLERVMEGRA